jgi:ribosomal protein S18 acetylase RimI-like enzyme
MFANRVEVWFGIIPTMMTITVQKVALEEIPQVKKLLSDTWSDTYGSVLSKSTIAKVTAVWHHPDNLKAQAQDPAIYFATAKDETGRIVGLVTVRKISADTLFMDRLYVHPRQQRQGIGIQLLETAITAFPAGSKLQLEVEEKNTKGVGFYQKHGFRELHRKEAHIEGEILHSIVMEKVLEEISTQRKGKPVQTSWFFFLRCVQSNNVV